MNPTPEQLNLIFSAAFILVFIAIATLAVTIAIKGSDKEQS
jgi:hypothetical protein